jgi:hypothetical protein
MNKVFAIGLLLFSQAVFAQSTTTEKLLKDYDGSFNIFFYHNTLRMFNQKDNKEFDDMVKDIEKMRVLIIDKNKMGFTADAYKKLVDGYQKESYEGIVSVRHDGKKLNVYVKEKNGKTKGTVLLANDSTSVYVLDILGSIDVSKASQFFSSIQENTEIGEELKKFLDEYSDVKKDVAKKHGE